MAETSARFELVAREHNVMVGSEEIATVHRAASRGGQVRWVVMMNPDGMHVHAAGGTIFFDTEHDAGEAAVAEWQKRLRS